MTTFARIGPTNKVEAVIDFPEGEPPPLDALWVECYPDASTRGCYPGPGSKYDPITDTFTPP